MILTLFSVVINSNVELTIFIVIYGPFCIVIGEKVASFFVTDIFERNIQTFIA